MPSLCSSRPKLREPSITPNRHMTSTPSPTAHDTTLQHRQHQTTKKPTPAATCPQHSLINDAHITWHPPKGVGKIILLIPGPPPPNTSKATDTPTHTHTQNTFIPHHECPAHPTRHRARPGDALIMPKLCSSGLQLREPSIAHNRHLTSTLSPTHTTRHCNTASTKPPKDRHPPPRVLSTRSSMMLTSPGISQRVLERSSCSSQDCHHQTPPKRHQTHKTRSFLITHARHIRNAAGLDPATL